MALSGLEGQFVITGVPPGEYKLFAWNTQRNKAQPLADFIAHMRITLLQLLFADLWTCARI